MYVSTLPCDANPKLAASGKPFPVIRRFSARSRKAVVVINIRGHSFQL